jgi:hypothetical protein
VSLVRASCYLHTKFRDRIYTVAPHSQPSCSSTNRELIVTMTKEDAIVTVCIVDPGEVEKGDTKDELE